MNKILVHVIAGDEELRGLLTAWLTAAGIESRGFAHLGVFLEVPHAELTGCVVIDAQTQAISGVETQALLLPLAVRCPIVVTAFQADFAIARRAMKRGDIDFVDKPLREPVFVAAVRAALEADHRQRLVESRRVELCARFETLSARQQQVMVLVTEGKLNKQIGYDLGITEITVKIHRRAVMRKMAARSMADLVRMTDALERNRDRLEVDRQPELEAPLPRIAVAAIAGPRENIGCLPRRNFVEHVDDAQLHRQFT